MAEPTMTKRCPRCSGSGRVPDAKAIGAEVKKRRLAKGWSLRELASMVGCSHVHIADMESGNRGWDGPAARRIQKKLGLSRRAPECVASEPGDTRRGTE